MLLHSGAVRMLWLSLAAFALLGQTQRGTVTLAVKDPTGTPMQAAGRIENRAAGVNRSFVTDNQGVFVFHDLPFGEYRIQVAKPGFKSQTVSVGVPSAVPVAAAVTLALAQSTTRIDVVAATPLSGTDLTKEQIASPVQTATAADVQNSGALDLSDFMNRQLNGVYVNEMQGNPFQPDINFRGYTASPLLGTPQGLSVYLDGVRQNQPFGDVVSWDLIPVNAISDVALMPDSNPLFGLNTLGGALSVQTKNGVGNPGFDAKLTYGSSGRKAIQASWGGGKAAGFNWFLAANAFHESGWRFDSPSDVRQFFVRLGWRTRASDFGLTLSYANNVLIGNGLQDYRLLAANYSSVYSIPDSTVNRSPAVNFMARHEFTPALTFSGNAWFRNIRTGVINANINTDVLGFDIYQPTAAEQATLAAAGYSGFPSSGANPSNTPFPQWSCIAEALAPGNPDQTCDGVNVYSDEKQNDYGASGQLTWIRNTGIGRNQLIAGAQIDRGSVDYTQNTEYGYVNDEYLIVGVPAWQAGSQVSLHGLTPNWSTYLTDTLTVAKNVNLTFSGRYNSFTIDNFDRLNPIPGPGSLTADYLFTRLNPAIGVTWSPTSDLNLYASYTEGSRAPTSIELGCADPNNPCALPNALSSDPPLEQVVTGTWEAGVRGKPAESVVHNFNWNAGAFRAENRNDILFVSSVVTGTGYFQNFARTRREGFDADISGRIWRITGGLNYTYLLATYQSTEPLDGSANSTSDSSLSGYPGLDGNIYVHPGDRIPLVPKHTGKAFALFQATPKLALDLDLVAISSSYVRGNENNAYAADGAYYLGPGVSPGYAAVNFLGHYDLTRRLQVALQVDNLFDRHYYTGGQLANTIFNAQGKVVTQPFPAYATGPYAGNYPAESATFFTPGAPRRAWVELRFRF